MDVFVLSPSSHEPLSREVMSIYLESDSLLRRLAQDTMRVLRDFLPGGCDPGYPRKEV
jgi:hypothetical protein